MGEPTPPDLPNSEAPLQTPRVPLKEVELPDNHIGLAEIPKDKIDDQHIFLNAGHTPAVYNVGLVSPEDLYEIVSSQGQQRIATIPIETLATHPLLRNSNVQAVLLYNLRKELDQETIAGRKTHLRELKERKAASLEQQKIIDRGIKRSHWQIVVLADQTHAVENFLALTSKRNVWQLPKDSQAAKDYAAIMAILQENLRALEEK